MTAGRQRKLSKTGLKGESALKPGKEEKRVVAETLKGHGRPRKKGSPTFLEKEKT